MKATRRNPLGVDHKKIMRNYYVRGIQTKIGYYSAGNEYYNE